MKNRYFTSTLILLVLLTCGILIKANSQIQPTPPKFKVAVSVQCEENSVHQSQVEGVIKRELRSFGDVEIVGGDLSNALWEYMIRVHLFGIDGTDGQIHHYATSIKFYKKVPIEHFNPDWQAHYREFPAVLIPSSATGTFGINKLEHLGIITAVDFDKEYLQPVRDVRSRYSR